AGSLAAGAKGLFAADSSNGSRLSSVAQAAATPVKGTRPLLIASGNGLNALDLGMGLLKRGHDTLDAVIAVVKIVEDDPRDNSVGYGGLPNEEGDVELDACCMHGPTRRAGAVASLRHIKNPSKVAHLVMEQTDHVLLVGPGALRFAEMHGFERMNLLTNESRIAWLRWKARTAPNWAPGLDSPDWKEKAASLLDPNLSEDEKSHILAWADDVAAHPVTGTINCLAVSEKGDISGTTTTSGLSWKIAGRVGDSPIIGAGLYVDNDVGAAGSTGRGEENIKVAGGHTIVELMRKGMAPTDACLEALSRIARNYNNDKTRLSKFYVVFYALNKDGVHGGAALWSQTRAGRPRTYAVHDGTQARLVNCAALFDGPSAY
ncbi:MAG: N(4)-(beta-N-acetylglucosaminyl)-L-asparaginase, partial [Burkholderiales bacterium]